MRIYHTRPIPSRRTPFNFLNGMRIILNKRGRVGMGGDLS